MKKINEETKTKIKELFATEKFTKAELGNMFGLAWHTIDRIITGKPNPKVNNKKYYKREKTKEYVRTFRKKRKYENLSDFEKYKRYIDECTHPEQTKDFQRWFEDTYYLPRVKFQFETLLSMFESLGVLDIDNWNDFWSLFSENPVVTVPFVEFEETDNTRCICIRYEDIVCVLYFNDSTRKPELIPDVDYYPSGETTIYNFTF